MHKTGINACEADVLHAIPYMHIFVYKSIAMPLIVYVCMHTVDSEDGSTFAVRATPRAFPRFRCLLLLALVQSDLVAELRMRACKVCVCACVYVCVYVCVLIWTLVVMEIPPLVMQIFFSQVRLRVSILG